VTSILRTDGLTKTFSGDLVAVDHIDLDVHEGDLFGFLGPNGAGKTTTIRMLLGVGMIGLGVALSRRRSVRA